MTDQRPLIEKVLDLVVYAPAGMVAQARHDLPKLVADGRARLENRVRVARWIGEMAVTTGRREIEKRLAPQQPANEQSPVAASRPGSSRPPFDGYDDLAAAQIVQLLLRLPHADLHLIRAYEADGRGRRTILHRIDQLLGT
ncbi:MAG: hypothetical protein Q7V57_06540 [Actinomycetota bacterium]|nr:hypothetical protein [Actinomycetota bacterium]